MGESQPAQDLLTEYEKRAKEVEDENYAKLEVDPIDVKEIQNTTSGVSGFWLRAMLNQATVAK
jgi:hypothetical protein